jgi:hypothetical protein
MLLVASLRDRRCFRQLRGADDRIVSSAWPQEWQTTKGDGLPHKVNSIEELPEESGTGREACPTARRVADNQRGLESRAGWRG